MYTILLATDTYGVMIVVLFFMGMQGCMYRHTRMCAYAHMHAQTHLHAYMYRRSMHLRLAGENRPRQQHQPHEYLYAHSSFQVCAGITCVCLHIYRPRQRRHAAKTSTQKRKGSTPSVCLKRLINACAMTYLYAPESTAMHIMMIPEHMHIGVDIYIHHTYARVY